VDTAQRLLRFQCGYCEKMFHHKRDKVGSTSPVALATPALPFRMWHRSSDRALTGHTRTHTHQRTTIRVRLLSTRLHSVTIAHHTHTYAHRRTSIPVPVVCGQLSGQVCRVSGRTTLLFFQFGSAQTRICASC
jgi:hypothetical protein